MKITVSGEKKEVKDGLTLPELIELENVETPEYVTVSINEEFIESDAKASTVLKDGDILESEVEGIGVLKNRILAKK